MVFTGQALKWAKAGQAGNEGPVRAALDVARPRAARRNAVYCGAGEDVQARVEQGSLWGFGGVWTVVPPHPQRAGYELLRGIGQEYSPKKTARGLHDFSMEINWASGRGCSVELRSGFRKRTDRTAPGWDHEKTSAV